MPLSRCTWIAGRPSPLARRAERLGASPRAARLAAVALLLAMALAANATEPGARAEADSSQPEQMLAFLERAAGGVVDEALVDRLLVAPGTELLLAQMNLVRRVSAEQYRALLLGIDRSEPPDLAPVDESERARNGVAGLRENVWPTLRWGLEHTALLRERLAQVRALEVYAAARRRAAAALPDEVEIAPEVYVVMGGRAGAAALAGSRIYVDILMLSYVDSLGRRPWSPESDVLANVAHEMHHVGYGEIVARQLATLSLSNQEALAYRVLVTLLSEGSATYLVSDRRDVATMLADPSLAGIAERGDALLAECEGVLRRLLAGEIASADELDRSSTFLLGSGAHIAGSLLLSRIDRAAGLEAVFGALREPRELATIYNRAVGSSTDFAGAHRFAPELASSLAAMGRVGGR